MVRKDECSVRTVGVVVVHLPMLRRVLVEISMYGALSSWTLLAISTVAFGSPKMPRTVGSGGRGGYLQSTS